MNDVWRVWPGSEFPHGPRPCTAKPSLLPAQPLRLPDSAPARAHRVSLPLLSRGGPARRLQGPVVGPESISPDREPRKCACAAADTAPPPPARRRGQGAAHARCGRLQAAGLISTTLFNKSPQVSIKKTTLSLEAAPAGPAPPGSVSPEFSAFLLRSCASVSSRSA